jgi:hypothetical protein
MAMEGNVPAMDARGAGHSATRGRKLHSRGTEKELVNVCAMARVSVNTKSSRGV